MCVQHIFAFTVPSSKQEEPDLLGEKQASDDGYAVTQMGSTYWAQFYYRYEMSQWFWGNLFWNITQMGNENIGNR